MSVTLASLKAFYNSPLGRKLAQDCARGLAHLPPPAKNAIIMGFGYTQPYLDEFAKQNRQCLAFMPAAMAETDSSAAKTPQISPRPNARSGKNRTGQSRQNIQNATLVEQEHKFPLDDAAIDYILVIHALEFSPDPQAMLRELWRILVPNGRLILIVPNRRGLWAHAEKTPFGHGEPYSHRQLAEILSRNGFDFGEIHEYVHFLPHKNHRFTLGSQAYEKLARHFFPYFGGVLMVEAQKRLYNPLLQANIKRRLVFLPDFTPQTASLKPQNFDICKSEKPLTRACLRCFQAANKA